MTFHPQKIHNSYLQSSICISSVQLQGEHSLQNEGIPYFFIGVKISMSAAISTLFIHKEARTVLVACAAPSQWFMHAIGNMFCLVNVMLASQTDRGEAFTVTKTDMVALRRVTTAGTQLTGHLLSGWLGHLWEWKASMAFTLLSGE